MATRISTKSSSKAACSRKTRLVTDCYSKIVVKAWEKPLILLLHARFRLVEWPEAAR
jgi:hypothetical protein